MGCSCIKYNLLENELSNEFKENEEENKKKIIIDDINNISNNNKELFKSEQLIIDKNTENTISSKDIILKSKNETPMEENNNSIHNNNSNIIINKEIESEYITKNIYNKRILEIINKVRLNPGEYSKYVIDNIKNISYENKEEINKNTEMKEIKQIKVFKKKVKVKLYKGEEEFLETAFFLKKLPSMEPLKFNENIVIPIDNIFNNELIKKKILKSNINLFFKGNIKNPEIAVLLMIVDDNESSEKKKRNALLNKDFKYIGIDSKFFGNHFLAHFSFSK